jgi:hypothetical protein
MRASYCEQMNCRRWMWCGANAAKGMEMAMAMGHPKRRAPENLEREAQGLLFFKRCAITLCVVALLVGTIVYT